MQGVLDHVKSLNLSSAHKSALATIPLLEGEYLIKLAKKHPWAGLQGHQYLGFLTFFVGLEFTKRKEAARFKKEELPEVIDRLNGLVGYKLVKF